MSSRSQKTYSESYRESTERRYRELAGQPKDHQYARMFGEAITLVDELLRPEAERTPEWEWWARRWLEVARDV